MCAHTHKNSHNTTEYSVRVDLFIDGAVQLVSWSSAPFQSKMAQALKTQMKKRADIQAKQQ